MSFNSIKIMDGYKWKIKKSVCGMTGDDSLVFPAKLLLCSVSICYCLLENQFLEVKKTTNSFTNEL